MGEISVFQMPFVGGFDQKTAQEYLDPSQKLYNIVNGNYVKIGAVDKRFGFQHISNALVPGANPYGLPAITSGIRNVGWSRSGLSVITAAGLYNFSPAENGLVPVSKLPAVKPLRRPITTSGTPDAPKIVDVPFGAGVLRIALYHGPNSSTGGGSVFATIYDADSGDLVMEPQQVHAALASDLANIIDCLYLPNAPVGKQVILVVQDVIATTVTAYYYNPSTNAWTSAGSLPTGAGGQQNALDFVPFIGDPNGGFLYVYASSVTRVNVQYYYPDLTLQYTVWVTTAGTEVLQYPFFVYGTYGTSGQHVWLAFTTHDPISTNYANYLAQYSGDGNFSLEQGPYQIDSPDATFNILSGLVQVDATHVFVNRWHASNPYGGQGISAPIGNWYVFNSSAVLTGSGPTPLGYYPQQRPFIVNGKVYQACYLMMFLQGGLKPSDVHSQQVTLYLLEYQAVNAIVTTNVAYPVSTVAPRIVNGSFAIDFLFFLEGHLAFMSQYLPGQTRFACGLNTLGQDTAGTSGETGPAWAVDFFFDLASISTLFQTTELGSELHLSGGVPFIADSNIAFEDNFFYYPEFSFLDKASGGNLVGSYTYALVYVYQDAAGLLHKSSPVLTRPVVMANDKGLVHITALSTTWRDVGNPGAVYAEIYRTLSNGSTFYLVDRTVISNTTATYVDYTDNASDTDVGLSTILYTTGGVLDNVNPPSSAFHIVHSNRVAMVDETLRTVWFTKFFTQGEAPGFNEVLTVAFPEGGDITGLGSMDDKFIVFKQSSVWVMYGQNGPGDTGQNSDWSVPQRVASDVGCIAWQSIVLLPDGLLFQAPTGIYLLSRNLQVTFIGRAVIDILAQYPTITSALLVPLSTQVRFTCSNGSTSVTIVYDYLLGEWTTHTYAQLSAPIAGACLTYNVPQQYTLFTTDGQIWRERLASDSLAYLDDDVGGTHHFVPTKTTSAWIKFQGVQGYQRAKRVQFYGDQMDSCGLQMDFAVNYNNAIIQTGKWTSDVLAALPITGQVEQHVGAAYNKQMSIQVTMTDSAGLAMTNGQGMRFVTLAMELEKIGDRYRQTPAIGRR